MADYDYFDRDSEMVSILGLAEVDIHHYRLLLLLLLNFPASFAFILVNRVLQVSVTVRHAISFTLGFGSLLWLVPLHSGIELLATSLVIYALARQRSVSVHPFVILAATLAQLIYTDWRYGRKGQYAVLAGIQMMALIKWSFFYNDAKDGVLLGKAARSSSSFPSPTAYLGFMFFFPCVAVGPAYRFLEYNAVIQNSFIMPGKVSE